MCTVDLYMSYVLTVPQKRIRKGYGHYHVATCLHACVSEDMFIIMLGRPQASRQNVAKPTRLKQMNHVFRQR